MQKALSVVKQRQLWQAVIVGGNVISAMGAITAFICAFLRPDEYWWAGFYALSIPFWIGLHITWLVFWGLQKKWEKLLISGITLLVGFRFCMAIFSISLPGFADADFTLLSQNVRVFNSYRDLHKDYKEAKESIRWAVANNADIKCFQEYYHYAGHKLGYFSTNDSLKRNGEYYAYVASTRPDIKNQTFGLAIFSRFPILKKGKIDIGTRSGNAAIYADVKVNDKVVRVINVHLQSLKINEEAAVNHYTEESTIKHLVGNLKYGFQRRTFQIHALEQAVKTSPFPVIICGDFNDTPYSYAYQTLRNRMQNAFEAEGNGFGISFNGKIPFLRIDHQFYTSELEAISFETDRSADFSDHFPTIGEYVFK